MKRSIYVFFSPLFFYLLFFVTHNRTCKICTNYLKSSIVPFKTKIPCCGAVNCLLWNFLHPKHFVITFFAICCGSEIQKFFLIATIVHIRPHVLFSYDLHRWLSQVVMISMEYILGRFLELFLCIRKFLPHFVVILVNLHHL